MKVRIAKFIASRTGLSRRVAERAIADGRVILDGVKISTPAVLADEENVILIDGKDISKKPKPEPVVYAYHKPLNTLVTTFDPQGRSTIYDVMPKNMRKLIYVGRLDFKTTGLLLMTNNGDLARTLTLPENEIPRTYIATVACKDLSVLDNARRGITVDGISYRPMKIDILSTTIHGAQIRITVVEGKKNEIRIALRACGAPVCKLHRVSFGNIELKNLPVGKFRIIPQKVIDEMIKKI